MSGINTKNLFKIVLRFVNSRKLAEDIPEFRNTTRHTRSGAGGYTRVFFNLQDNVRPRNILRRVFTAYFKLFIPASPPRLPLSLLNRQIPQVRAMVQDTKIRSIFKTILLRSTCNLKDKSPTADPQHRQLFKKLQVGGGTNPQLIADFRGLFWSHNGQKHRT